MEEAPSVLVCGAGVFGASTALHLIRSKRYSKVTIIDRADILPAVDAASTDINKIIRYDYQDETYARLTLEAIDIFNTPEWQGIFHQSGVLCYGKRGEGSFYDASLKNVTHLDGKPPPRFDVPADLAKYRRAEGKVPAHAASPKWPQDNEAYLNRNGGWGESTESVARVLRWIEAEGGIIVPGQQISGFSFRNKRLSGVKTSKGRLFEADIVVLALGAWTENALRDTPLATPPNLLHATGQCLTTYRLTDEQAEKHRHDPVLLCIQSGFYMFPPNKDNLVKATFHKPFPYGYSNRNTQTGISTPLTILDKQGEDGFSIPPADLRQSREALALHYPDLADAELFSTRLCWYTDVPDHNFVIDRHSACENVLLATGGSGHGYKFLPIIGKYVLQRLENTLEKGLAEKWALKDRPRHLQMSTAPPNEIRDLKEALRTL